ncbi:MAG: hypothetical protein QNI84_08120 [Henriciella sp.]|nr:hypothetical protein [Henriciella sp.]
MSETRIAAAMQRMLSAYETNVRQNTKGVAPDLITKMIEEDPAVVEARAALKAANGEGAMGEHMQQHYVEFLSPGTFMSESSKREIASWDTAEAIRMMSGIVERHGTRPYGFRFSTRARDPNDLDSREVARSHFYYVNCDVLTAEEVLAETNAENRIMRANVENNGYKRIARTRTGWLGHFPMNDADEVIEAPELAKETP